jgi:hypothetical protein
MDLGPDDFLHVVRRTCSTDWQRHGEIELNRPLDGRVFRALLLVPDSDDGGHELVFSTAHAVADLVAVTNLVDDFLKALAAIVSGEGIEPAPLGFPLSPEQVAQRFPDASVSVSSGRPRQFDLRRTSPSGGIPPYRKKVFSKRRTEFSMVELGAELSRHVHETAAREDATVFSYFTAALILACRSEFGPLPLSFSVPVGYRPLFAPHLNAGLGCYIRTLAFEVPGALEDSSLAGLARRLQAATFARLSAGAVGPPIPATSEDPKFARKGGLGQRFRRLRRNAHRELSSYLSCGRSRALNVVEAPFDTPSRRYGPIEVSFMCAVVDIASRGELLGVTVGGRHDGTSLSFYYPAPLLQAPAVTAIGRRTKEILRSG